MSIERAALRGKMAEAEQKRDKFKLSIEGFTRYIRQGLNTALTTPEELEIPLLDEQWDDLKKAWIDLHLVLGEIAKLEKELR